MTAKHTPAQTLDRPPITEREDALLHALITALPYVETAEHDDAYTPGAVRKVVNLIRAAVRAYDPPAPGAIAEQPATTQPEVWVLHLTHRHGDDVTVYQTEQGAKTALAEYVREWWSEQAKMDGTPIPDDPEAMVAAYYDQRGDESANYYPAQVGD